MHGDDRWRLRMDRTGHPRRYRSPSRSTGCTVVDVNGDGLVTRWRDYFDLQEIERQADPGRGGRGPEQPAD